MKTRLFIIKRHIVAVIRRLNFNRLINLIKLIIATKFRKLHLTHYPVVARINTISTCNLVCPGCKGKGYTSPNESSHVMRFAEYKQIINMISDYVMLVILYDEGEPLLNKDIFKMIKYTSGLNISTSISTNLSIKLKESDINNLVLSGLGRLIIGLDGMTQDVYGRYRINGNVKLVKDNLIKIIQAKKVHKAKYPIIEVQFLNFGYNEHQMHDAELFAKSSGADLFKSRYAKFDGFYRFDGTESERIRLGCLSLWAAIHINNDGMMYPCHHGEDYGMKPLGSIFKNNFNILWNSTRMRDLRKSFNRKNKKLGDKVCTQCPEYEALPRILQ